MDRGDDPLGQVGFENLPSLAGNAERGSKNRLGRGRSRQTNTSGLTTRNSASSQGRQAAMSRALGF